MVEPQATSRCLPVLQSPKLPALQIMSQGFSSEKASLESRVWIRFGSSDRAFHPVTSFHQRYFCATLGILESLVFVEISATYKDTLCVPKARVTLLRFITALRRRSFSDCAHPKRYEFQQSTPKIVQRPIHSDSFVTSSHSCST